MQALTEACPEDSRFRQSMLMALLAKYEGKEAPKSIEQMAGWDSSDLRGYRSHHSSSRIPAMMHARHSVQRSVSACL